MNFVNGNIFSIDEARYYIKSSNEDGKVFCKKSTLSEYNSLLLAKEILSSFSSLEINNHNYKICVPDVYGYENNIIEMQYFDGQNLELLLQNFNTHLQGVDYLNNIFLFLINNGFNWVDFAPRNILLSDDKICLIDFEKSLSGSINDKIKYLQNHVYEEYASFIFENERLYSIDDIFPTELSNNNEIDLQSIKIKRCKYLCEILYNKHKISTLEYFHAWRMILKSEIPFVLDKDMIFPRIYLSKILENKDNSIEPYYLYANRVIKVNECSNLEEKARVLKKLNNMRYLN